MDSFHVSPTIDLNNTVAKTLDSVAKVDQYNNEHGPASRPKTGSKHLASMTTC